MSFTSETGALGLAIQATKGVNVQPGANDYIRVTQVDINPEAKKLIPNAEIGGSADVTEILQGEYGIKGSLDAYVRPEVMGILFYGALGKYTASGSVDTGAYLHNFQPIASGSLPWLSIKKSISDNVVVFDYTDCKVDGFSLDINANEICSAKFPLSGISDAIGTPATPGFEEGPLLAATKATINLNGVPVQVQKCSVELKNNLDDKEYVIGSRFKQDITAKRRELTVKLDIILDTTTNLYQKAFYGAGNATSAGLLVEAESFDIILDSPTKIGVSNISYKCLLSIKNAVFMSAPIPASGDNLVVISLELQATKLAGQNIIDIKLWNDRVTY